MNGFDLLNIDWNKTVEKFFADADDVLANNFDRMARMKNNDFYGRANVFYHAFNQLHTIAENPRKYAGYAARVQDKLVIVPEVFIPYGTSDNSMFLEFEHVLYTLEQFYPYENLEVYQRNLLDALKKWNYAKSKNKFKDLYYSFLSPMRFAVKKQIQK